MNIKRSKFELVIGALIIILVALGIYIYYKHKALYPNTDNAYVNARFINVASKVNGTIRKVYISNNQQVHEGDIMLKIDPVDYQALSEKADVEYQLATQGVTTALKQLSNAKADVKKAQANANYCEKMASRYIYLFQQKAGSQQAMEKFVSDREQANQVLDQAKTVLQQADIQYQMAQEKVKLTQVAVDNANLTVSYTELRAPFTGRVSDMNLSAGQLIAVGEKLFGLVDESYWWIDANFKETQLERLHASQKATIQLDMYHHTYEGELVSISPASGGTFSLLPAQNASGNWVKVTQRFTVRIALKDDSKFPLRVGASANVTVDTTQDPAKV